MVKFSLKDAIQNAGEYTSGGGSKAWEEDDYALKIIRSNVRPGDGAPKIGFHAEREDGRKAWFDIWFDPYNKGSWGATSRTLKSLGLSELVFELNDRHGLEEIDEDDKVAVYAALRAIAEDLHTSLVGIEFVGHVIKKSTSAPNVPEDEKVYKNYLQYVKELLGGVGEQMAAPPGPNNSGLSGLSGLMG